MNYRKKGWSIGKSVVPAPTGENGEGSVKDAVNSEVSEEKLDSRSDAGKICNAEVPVHLRTRLSLSTDELPVQV